MDRADDINPVVKDHIPGRIN